MAVDLSTVPLVAISEISKQAIATSLNSRKFLLCENNLPRDWRGLAYLLDLSGDIISLVSSNSNPTMHIFALLKQNQKSISIKDFQAIMEDINRWDIIDDTATMLENDAVRYLELRERSEVSADIDKDISEEVLTSDDIHRLNQGLETQRYDAFLLHADEDAGFAKEMVQRLEGEYNLKLCLKERDLIAGLKFEHEAIMRLISDRCNRLLIIISPDFLQSMENEFFMNYAQALSIEKRQRKIIPCLYKKCELPLQLKYMFILNYDHKGLYDFWSKLYNSIKPHNSKALSAIQKIREVTNVSDKHNDVSQICEKVYETSKYSQHDQKVEGNVTEQSMDLQKRESCSIESSNTEDPSAENKKKKTLLHWIKGVTNRKTGRITRSSQPIMETVENLPSLDNLDSLDLSSSSLDEKKNSKKKFDKLTKKIRGKRFATKAW